MASLLAATEVATTFEMDHSVPAGYQNYRTSYYLPSAVVVGRAAGKGCTKSVLVGSGVGSLGRTLHTPVPLLGAASRIEVREPASLPSSVQGDQELASSTVLVSVHAAVLAAAAEPATPFLSLVHSPVPSQLRPSPSPLSPSPPVPSSPSPGWD